MDDKIFQVDLERSRIYWDYYKSMFLVFSLTLMTGMICASIVFTSGYIDLTFTIGIIILLFLCIILLAALMSLSIWRHENKHLDEMIKIEEDVEETPPPGMPLV